MGDFNAHQLDQATSPAQREASRGFVEFTKANNLRVSQCQLPRKGPHEVHPYMRRNARLRYGEGALCAFTDIARKLAPITTDHFPIIATKSHPKWKSKPKPAKDGTQVPRTKEQQPTRRNRTPTTHRAPRQPRAETFLPHLTGNRPLQRLR
eukprot:PhF_6_TR10965/c2_g1_i1/m.17684